ncbi:MAG: GFA family protein [Candidatus Binataceae bacterium]
MLTGRCLCGGVRFEIDGRLGPVIYCHCSMCRHANGSSFATNASVRTVDFRIVTGSELVKEYESSPGNLHAFCSKCGSPLYGTAADVPSIRRVRLGTLDNADGAKSVAHIWVGSKSDWFEITDSLKQFEEQPPSNYCAPG